MKPFFSVLLLLSCLSSPAQQPSLYDSVRFRHDRISSGALVTLMGWSAASIGSGFVGKNNSTGDVREFHRRNITFGSINLAISGLGLWRVHSEARRRYTPGQTVKRLNATQRILLFNAGLDLAYVAYGLYTRERAFRYTGAKADKLRGTGNSLLVQGAFLTVFDFVQYALQRRNAKRLDGRLETLSFAPTENGLGLVYRF